MCGGEGVIVVVVVVVVMVIGSRGRRQRAVQLPSPCLEDCETHLFSVPLQSHAPPAGRGRM